MDHMDPINLVALAIQTIVMLLGLGIAWGSLNSTIKGHGVRLVKVEAAIERQVENSVAFARYEERNVSMDQRVLAQGQRLDSTQSQLASRIDTHATLINGRLEAINNIVAGHTAQIAQLTQRQTRTQS